MAHGISLYTPNQLDLTVGIPADVTSGDWRYSGALIDTTIAPGGYEVRNDAVPSPDPAGFDTCTMDVLFRGNQASLLSAFSAGALNCPDAPAGNRLYCIGPQGAQKNRFGHIWATIAWKGFLKERDAIAAGFNITMPGLNVYSTQITFSGSSRETQFPKNYEAFGTTKLVYVVGAGWTPTANGINPATGGPWRVNLIDETVQATVQGVSLGTATGVPPPPRLTGTLPALTAPGGGAPINWNQLEDPTINFPYGWVRRNFQVNSAFVVGTVVMYFWTATFEFVDRKAP